MTNIEEYITCESVTNKRGTYYIGPIRGKYALPATNQRGLYCLKPIREKYITCDQSKGFIVPATNHRGVCITCD